MQSDLFYKQPLIPSLKRRLLLLLILLTVCTCNKSTDPETTESSLIISHLGVLFGPWNPATNRAGDFLFRASEQKVFLEFGAVVGMPGGGTKELPTYEYRIRKDAFVYAICDGKVTRFVYQSDTQDYEIGMRYSGNSDWEIGYDHIKNPRVGENDVVSAGDTLGNPGTWNSTLGRFEIMINNLSTDHSYCPVIFFHSDSAAVFLQQIDRHIQDWETFKGDTTIYDDHLFSQAGCRMDSMVTY